MKSMGPIEPANSTNLSPSRRRSRRSSRSRSNDRHSSSSTSSSSSSSSSRDRDRDDDDRSFDEDDDRNSSYRQLEPVRWDYRMNSVGRRVRDSKVSCCSICQYPVLLVGRLIPCKHASFCLQCANDCKSERRTCPKCNDSINDIEKIEAKHLFLCSFGSPQDLCLRGYTSQRDLQAHIKRRHESTHMDSPHQLIQPIFMESPVTQSPTITSVTNAPPSNPTVVVAPPNVAAAVAAVPNLLPFPPPPPPPPPPPIFDPNFRPGNFRMSPQPFVSPGGPFRGGPYPPPRPFY